MTQPNSPALDPLTPEDASPLAPQRISMQAIIALAFSIMCVPPLSTVGAVLGISAIVRISRAAGRLGGRSLAIAAIVLGLLASALWVGLGIGAGQFWTLASRSTTAFLTDLDRADLPAARALLHPSTATTITDAQLSDFAARARAGAGTFTAAPPGILQAVLAYWRTPLRDRLNEAKPMADANLRPVAIPLTFSGGTALLVMGLSLDSFSKPQPFQGEVHNLLLLTDSQQPGQGIWLVPPPTQALPPTQPNARP